MSRYRNIRTADELQAAISSLRREIKRQEKKLDRSYVGLREHYSPMNMVSGLIRKKPGFLSWTDMSLRVLRSLRERYSGK